MPGIAQVACIFYNKLENNISNIGPNFATFGVDTRNPAKFNDGYYSGDNADYLQTANDGAFNPNACIFEWWMRTDYNVVNGAPSDGGNHIFGFWGVAANPTIFIASYPAPNNFYVYIDTGPAAGIGTAFAVGNWLAGADVHAMVAINPSGIAGGANTIRIYFDGALTGSSNVALAAFTVVGTEFFKIGGGPWFVGETMDAVMDNLKIYDGTSQALIDAIIANRNNEGWPIAATRPRARIN